MDWKNDPRNFTTVVPPMGVKIPAVAWYADWKKKAGYRYVIKSGSRQPDTIYEIGFNRDASCTEAVPSIKKHGMVPKITPYTTDPLSAEDKAFLEKFVPFSRDYVKEGAPKFCPSDAEAPKAPSADLPAEAKAEEVPWYMNTTYWAGFAVGAVVITLWNRRK